MFTGLVRKKSKVTVIEQTKAGLTLSVEKPPDWSINIGDSISLNGVCSTVTQVSPNLSFEYMPETIERSNLEKIKEGDYVNLEQSLKVNGRLDGHIVQGHVDTTAIIKSITQEGNSKVLVLENADVSLIAPKGSITLEGISLTVVDVKKDSFSVKIIPHTWEHTNLCKKNEKDALNVEFDILAKYLKQLIHATSK